MPYAPTTGLFDLKAGQTYRLTASVSMSGGNTGTYSGFKWAKADNSVLPNCPQGAAMLATYTGAAASLPQIQMVYTPAVDEQIRLIQNIGQGISFAWMATGSWATVEQIGTTAVAASTLVRAKATQTSAQALTTGTEAIATLGTVDRAHNPSRRAR